MIDDAKINNVKDLIKVITKHDVGDVVNVGLFRGQKKIQLKTRIERAPSDRMNQNG
ncbi:Uncharacterised protein [uncultured archaeon]|nr:Uncharacterised protein [uncultured archaeon]